MCVGMKLDFGKKTMDIGTPAFNFVRTLMVAGTHGAEINECLLVADTGCSDSTRAGQRPTAKSELWPQCRPSSSTG